MSKAVLVIETPADCWGCNFRTEGDECLAMDVSSIEVDVLKGKPDWCPLKPMLAKKEENYRSEFARGIKKGWNDAIKAIENNPHK